jgi:hypothetical protein
MVRDDGTAEREQPEGHDGSNDDAGHAHLHAERVYPKRMEVIQK